MLTKLSLVCGRWLPEMMEMAPPMDKPPGKHRLLGQILLELGVISEDQLRIALQEQTQSHQLLGRILVTLGFISEAILTDVLSASLGTKSVVLAESIVDAAAIALVPEEFARQFRLLPLAWDGCTLSVAMADVHDIIAEDRLRGLLPKQAVITQVLAGESEIFQAIDRHYRHELAIDGILHEIETGEVEQHAFAGVRDEYSQPVVRLVDALLCDAVRRDASDIHFEPERNFLRIRYRIDGILRQIRALHIAYWPAMAVRIKVMSGLNIAETRAPQDGHIALNVSSRLVDFRVSAHPTIHGENLVLRILDRQKGLVPLSKLGLLDWHVTELRTMVARPNGLILMTGPTGSGKTTTLYAVLNQINKEDINIMTLEDPVEYPLPLVRQTAISETTRLNFADGIRSMMRQDPDVILVGEIRDRDTAEMAFRAAMTGHQVYSTLHTHSVFGVMPRLLDIGIQPDIMAGNIIGLVAQRLVRRLCGECKRPVSVSREQGKLLSVADDVPSMVYQPQGCPACDHQGYRGRMAIMESLVMDAELDELLTRRGSQREIRLLAEGKGFRSLAQDGLARVLDGSTSLSEIARVVDLGHGALVC